MCDNKLPEEIDDIINEINIKISGFYINVDEKIEEYIKDVNDKNNLIKSDIKTEILKKNLKEKYSYTSNNFNKLKNDNRRFVNFIKEKENMIHNLNEQKKDQRRIENEKDIILKRIKSKIDNEIVLNSNLSKGEIESSEIDNREKYLKKIKEYFNINSK